MTHLSLSLADQGTLPWCQPQFLHLHQKEIELRGFQVPLPCNGDLLRTVFQLGEPELGRMVWVCTPCPAHLSLQQNVLKVTEQEDGRGGVYTQDCEERGMRTGLGQTSSSGCPGGLE